MSVMYYEPSNELCHYGIKGMKWGVRRFQNQDGSLTSAGRKHISKKYKKLANKTAKAYNSKAERMYVKAYNKTASEFNVDEFNNNWKKKHGDDAFGTSEYFDTYEREFGNAVARNMNRSLRDFYDNDENLKKAQTLVERYNMEQWDELAAKNAKSIDEVRRAVEEYDK